MSNIKYLVGDVVRLGSGGPWMTVEAAGNSLGEVKCVWFNPLGGGLYDAHPMRQTFLASQLVKADAKG